MEDAPSTFQQAMNNIVSAAGGSLPPLRKYRHFLEIRWGAFGPYENTFGLVFKSWPFTDIDQLIRFRGLHQLFGTLIQPGGFAISMKTIEVIPGLRHPTSASRPRFSSIIATYFDCLYWKFFEQQPCWDASWKQTSFFTPIDYMKLASRPWTRCNKACVHQWQWLIEKKQVAPTLQRRMQ